MIDVAVPCSGRLVCGSLTLDVDAHRLWVAGEPAQPFHRQFLLLVGSWPTPAEWQVSATPKQVAGAIHLLRKRLAAAAAYNAIRTMTPAGYPLTEPRPPDSAAGATVAPGT